MRSGSTSGKLARISLGLPILAKLAFIVTQKKRAPISVYGGGLWRTHNVLLWEQNTTRRLNYHDLVMLHRFRSHAHAREVGGRKRLCSKNRTIPYLSLILH